MSVRKHIGANFVGNAWNGLLIVVTTPWYVAMLGMEGFGVVGFWQLLLYVFLVFDLGLGASVVREFAAYRGAGRRPGEYRALLFRAERACLALAVLVGAAIFLAAPWIGRDWLRLEALSPDVAALSVRFMSVSIAAQLLNALYANGLIGLQNHTTMNLLQMIGHGLRYLGGGLVLSLGGDLPAFFAFQAAALLVLTGVARATLLRRIGDSGTHYESNGGAKLWTLRGYAGGMFVTALLGMLLANTDRILLSKLVPTDDLGRYSLALAGAGFLQMLVFALHRSYFPIFAQLEAAGQSDELKSTYYAACRLAGLFILPAAAIGWTFSGQLITVWIGSADPLAEAIFRLLIVGTACAGLMWLPAGLQQACGWTSLHSSLMAAALVIGAPVAYLAIERFGVIGGAAVMLVHGAIEITLGLWLMNRVLFRGESAKWYLAVVLPPLLVSIPLLAASRHMMPEDLSRWGLAAWIGGSFLLLLPFLAAIHRKPLFAT